MAAAIETEDLTKDFLVGFWRPRPYRALHGLTLSVDPGEVIDHYQFVMGDYFTDLPHRRQRAHPGEAGRRRCSPSAYWLPC